MKKILYIASAFVLMIISFLVVSHYFPKSVGRFPFFVLLFLLDFYLYRSLRHKIKSLPVPFTHLATILYWLPALLTGLIISSLVFYPFEHWGKGIRIYLVGFIFISYFSKLIPVVFLIIDDLSRVTKKIFTKKKSLPSAGSEKITRSVFIRRLGLISGGILFSGLFTGMVKWVTDFRIRHERIKLKGLPSSFNGYRIVQFSDIHLGGWASREELDEAVMLMNELKPDVIVFTGDLVNYKTDEAISFMDILQKLSAPDGIFAILGNHDYGDYSPWKDTASKERNMLHLYDFYELLGWKLLRNENHILKKDYEELALLGVENWGSLGRFQKYGDLEKALSGLEHIPAKILLSHDPSHWELKVLNSPVTIGLTLAGHTHGAQFGMEFKAFRWSPAQYIYKYWAGLYSEKNNITGDDQYLYVNRGIGTIGYPGRVGILPEITLLELQS